METITHQHLNDREFKRTEKGDTVPSRQPSDQGHIQSYGGEMLTWAVEGSLTGMAIGAVVGTGLYLTILFDLVAIAPLEPLELNYPIVFAIVVVVLSTLVGAAAGAAVGIGTPKFNPHPQQGWVRSWKTFVSRRANKDQSIYYPEFKNAEIEAHRQNQRG